MRTLLLPITLLATLVSTAQPSSSSTELWVTYMENLTLQFNGPPSFSLVISSDVATQGEVQIPYTGFSIPFTVAALSDTVIDLPTNIYYPEGDETIFNFGMRVVADDPVSVYAYHNRVCFSEAAMALPIERLGADHLVLAHEDAAGASPSELVVLATSDSTEVEVTPSILTVGFRPPGVPFMVLLDQGQVFQLQAFGDLSGTRVRSLDATKKLAVFAGARQARVNCAGAADDHLYQQVEPLVGWGSTFRIVPFKLRNGDEVRVLSAVDNTLVTITGQAPITLDSGEVADLFVSVPLTISASSPVAVGQFNDSQDCNGTQGDPCFLWVHPSEMEDQRAIWTSRTGIGSGTPEHFVNIVATGEAGTPQVILDGIDVGPQLQPMTGSPGVYWGQFDITAGEHRLESAQGFQAWAYGMGFYDSYSFPLGYGPANQSTGLGKPLSTVSGSKAILAEAGSTLDRGPVGLEKQAALEVFDATGRVVWMEPPGTTLRMPVRPGTYIIMPRGAADRSAVRLLVR